MNDLPTIMNEESGKRAMGRQEIAKAALLAAIDKTLLQNLKAGACDVANCAYNVMATLASEDAHQWTAIREHIALEAITAIVHRRLVREIKAEARADARQGVLALPGFELVSPWVKVEKGIAPLNKVTLEQHRDSVKDRAARIKQNEYPRWSEERTKREKAALAQERKLDRKVTPLTAGDKEMEMGLAMAMYEAGMETRGTEQRRKANKSRWNRKKVLT
jgi:hypothetical protein